MANATGIRGSLNKITLREMRTRIPMSQVELARKADLNVVHYRRIEYGFYPGIRSETVRRLAKAFNVQPGRMVMVLRATVERRAGQGSK